MTEPDGGQDAGLATVVIDEHEGVPVATVRGELDISNVDTIRRRLTDLPNLAFGIVLDLSGVDFMDSSGIALLYDLEQRFSRRSQRLIVVSPPGSAPRRTLELVGLPTLATVIDELPEGIAALRTAPE